MATKTRRKPARKTAPADSGITGRYVYDEKTDRLVKVSDRIPSVASKSSSRPTPCGSGPCGRSRCPR
ncbi:hypothetical protein EPO15_14745 [bacterium]|nr:MAG: hypothetical protein EPO15_14745 [bacterium]